MSFRADERGRVPFALIGIVLLLGSAAFTVGLQPDRPASEPAVDVVMDRATAATTTELRTAIVTASDEAARRPVRNRSNTPAGGILDEDETFRDALRVRIYLRARDRLANTEITQQGVTATASLPPTPNASALREAKQRVHIETVDGNETKLRVRIENVTVTAKRENRAVGTKQMSPSLTVRTPVLAVHNQVGEFETRLAQGLDKPGLSQRLTGRLYALTWARGYAQYGSGGQAITNVLGNRHVALMTNGALLREQRAAFNQSDGTGRRALSEAMVNVGLSDLLAESPVGQRWVAQLVPSGPPGDTVPQRISRYAQSSNAPDPDSVMRVGVNETADHAFADAVERSNLTEVLQSVYSADAKLVAEVEGSGGRVATCNASKPDPSYRLTHSSKRATIEESEAFDPRPEVPSAGPGWQHNGYAGRELQLNVTRTCHWEYLGRAKGATEITDSGEYRVRLSLQVRHAQIENAPEHTIEDWGDSGRFGGLDRSKLEDRAWSRLVGGTGWKALAKQAAMGTLYTRTEQINADVPDGLRQQAIEDIVSLRPAVRNTSVTVQRGRAGTFQANPAGQLWVTLNNNRDSMIDAPATYQTVGQKARIAARGAYIEQTKQRLYNRHEDRNRRQQNLTSVLEAVGASKDLVENALTARHGVPRTDDAGIDGVRITAVDGSPPYLTTTSVGDEYVESLPANESVHPLAARNWNVFTLPHGDATDTLLSAVGLGKKVRFRTAAQTLSGLETATDVTGDGTVGQNLSRQQSSLNTAVEGKLQTIRTQYLRRALSDAGVGEGRADRLEIIDDGLDEWDTTAGTALAVSNGSAAAAITDEAVSGNETKRALVRANIQKQLRRAGQAANTRIPQENVDKASALMRSEVTPRLNEALRAGMENGSRRVVDRVRNRLGKSVNSVPAGLPLLPFGTPWWATTNLWYVEVKGGYDRFAVRADTGGADTPGHSLTYVRDGSVARMDFDDDGTSEVFGRAERVSFTARTAVAIVVPPGGQGVGDRDGNMDEKSAGWSTWGSVDTSGQGNTTDRPVPAGWPERERE